MIVHLRRADLPLLVCLRLLLRYLLRLLLVDDAALLVSEPAAGAATLATIAALRNSPGGDVAGRAVQRRITDVVRWAEDGSGDTVDAVAQGGRHGVRLDSAERRWAIRKGQDGKRTA